MESGVSGLVGAGLLGGFLVLGLCCKKEKKAAWKGTEPGALPKPLSATPPPPPPEPGTGTTQDETTAGDGGEEKAKEPPKVKKKPKKPPKKMPPPVRAVEKESEGGSATSASGTSGRRTGSRTGSRSQSRTSRRRGASSSSLASSSASRISSQGGSKRGLPALGSFAEVVVLREGAPLQLDAQHKAAFENKPDGVTPDEYRQECKKRLRDFVIDFPLGHSPYPSTSLSSAKPGANSSHSTADGAGLSDLAGKDGNTATATGTSFVSNFEKTM